jgi:hypothetical protein
MRRGSESFDAFPITGELFEMAGWTAPYCIILLLNRVSAMESLLNGRAGRDFPGWVGGSGL